MRVLLVTVPTVFKVGIPIDMTYLESMGILYLASALIVQGHEVECWDSIILGGIPGLKSHVTLEISSEIRYLGIHPNYLQIKIRQFKPDIVGVSISNTSDWLLARAIMSSIKQDFPDITIIAGGPHVTQNIVECANCEYIDFAVAGEGEVALPKLVEEIGNGNMYPDIPGVCYKNHISSFELIKNIDDVALPAWGRLPMSAEFMHWCNGEGRKISIYSSRGCPFDCTFCSSKTLNKRRWRAHSVDRVIYEIDLLVNKFKVDGILFRDDNPNVDIDRYHSIMERIVQNEYNICVESANMRADNLPKETIELMKRAGFYRINLFPESGNQRVLSELMNKHLDLSKFHETAENILNAGLDLGLCFIIGMPGETMEEINQTIELARDLKKKGANYFQISIATPIKGTQMYQDCIDRGYIKDVGVDTFGYHMSSFDTEHWKGEDLVKLREAMIDELNA